MKITDKMIYAARDSLIDAGEWVLRETMEEALQAALAAVEVTPGMIEAFQRGSGYGGDISGKDASAGLEAVFRD